jgi:hypothetical protein
LRWTLGLGEMWTYFGTAILPLLKLRALRDNTSNAIQWSPLWYCCSHDLYYNPRPLLYYGCLDRLYNTIFQERI